MITKLQILSLLEIFYEPAIQNLFSNSKSPQTQLSTSQITLESWLGFGKQILSYRYVRRDFSHAGQVLEIAISKTKSKSKTFSDHPYFQKLARIWKANPPIQVRTKRFFPHQPGVLESAISKTKSKSKTFSDHPYCL